jgi:F-type H+-transporting ATPase subunit epsilon
MGIQCSITTPEKLVYQGAARVVVVPASDGELGILSRHAALMALLGTGELRLEEESGSCARFFISGGFVQVADNEVNILATEAEAAGDIDSVAAQAALDSLRAEVPSSGLSADERNEWNGRVTAAQTRVKIASRAG